MILDVGEEVRKSALAPLAVKGEHSLRSLSEGERVRK
jgi:hypothetical protein